MNQLKELMMENPSMFNRSMVSIEIHHKIEQFLYAEARLLDNEMLREWFATMLDPAIRYQMVIRQERFRRDKTPREAREMMPFDEQHGDLDLRIRQFETGLQTMLDPPQTIRRAITNIEAFYGDKGGEYLVRSYGIASRHRRLYECEQIVYARTDVLKEAEGGGLRIASRCIDLGERVVRNKNLLFFL